MNLAAPGAGTRAGLVLVDVDELEDRIRRAVRSEIRAALAKSPDQTCDWMDARAAASFLGINIRTLTRKATRGEVRASRIGKLWRFRRGDLEAQLAGEGDR